MPRITIRQDDFDFRLEPKQYIDNHEKFIRAGLTETAVVQYTHDGREPNYHPELIKYMNEAPNWDIQLHGWEHAEYDKMSPDDILSHLQKSVDKAQELFGKKPTIWFTPWNRRNEIMEDVARSFGITISNESNDISKFIREMKDGTFNGTTLYYHLWNRDEAVQIDEMIEYAKKYESRG
jgi:peptidoglycan/xylan/chitin deacetylase (PgdA/CDA1 family)